MSSRQLGERNSSNSQYEQLYGREVIYTSFTERELQEPSNIGKLLEDVLPIHFRNADQIAFLRNYVKGYQDILEHKDKSVRDEIDHRVVENNTFFAVEFKKGYVFGDAVQCVSRGEKDSEEIDVLNDYFRANTKELLDKEMGDEMYVSGTGYRMALPNTNFPEIESPFLIHNIPSSSAFVVYSTEVGNRALLNGYLTQKKDYESDSVYYICTIYTRSKVYKFKIESVQADSGAWTSKYVEPTVGNPDSESEINGIGELPIIEYPLNKSRIGIVELIRPIADTLNNITSLMLDDIDQFVQSLIFFTNVEIDNKKYKEMRKEGVAMLKNNNQNTPSKVDILTQNLDYAGIQSKYDDMYSKFLAIAGVPRMSESGSRGDTGAAKEIGDGWQLANERRKQDGLAFVAADTKLLRVILGVCSTRTESKVKNLKTNDIEFKFNWNRSDNLLVKAQSLTGFKDANLPLELALEACGLFSDPSAVAKRIIAEYGGNPWVKEFEAKIKKDSQPSADGVNKEVSPPTGKTGDGNSDSQKERT